MAQQIGSHVKIARNSEWNKIWIDIQWKKNGYRKISNTIRTLVQYAPQTFTRELWENVSLAVQYAPVLCHPSPLPSMPSATSTKGVSCSVAGAGKVTLIGSNCPASRVGRPVDCEGGGTAQIFSDCAITKYLSRVTARRPCGVRPPNNSSCGESLQLLLFCDQYSQ